MPETQSGASPRDRLKALCLYPLPHHALSRLVGWLARRRWRPVKNGLIRCFARRYGVNWSEAVAADPDAYAHFNAFFTRPLVEGARPMPTPDRAVACPADGTISQMGAIDDQRLFQAKGRWYGLRALVGDAELANALRGGLFATIYLAPRDYHRVHMPVGGHLHAMRHIPGRLFSVAPHTVRVVPDLFARNERVVTAFNTPQGPLVVVLVGAMCVASIQTAWHGVVTPPRGHQVRHWSYAGEAPYYARGDELGRFNMGSTAIVLLGRGQADWRNAHQAGDSVRMGQTLGTLRAHD